MKETIKARKIIDPEFWSLEKGKAGKAGKSVSRRGAERRDADQHAKLIDEWTFLSLANRRTHRSQHSSFGRCAKLFDSHIRNVSRNKEATYIVQVGDVAFRILEGDILSLICHDHDS